MNYSKEFISRIDLINKMASHIANAIKDVNNNQELCPNEKTDSIVIALCAAIAQLDRPDCAVIDCLQSAVDSL